MLNKSYKLTISGIDDRSDDNYDSNQLSKGIEIEKEHTDNEIIAKIIAKDHLDECKDYYTKLKQMELKCENSDISVKDMDKILD